MTQNLRQKKRDKDEKKAFEEALNRYSILIVDGYTPSRTGIARMLSQMGVKSSNIRLAATYELAMNEMNEKCPTFIISDFKLGNHSGLELSEALRERYPNHNDTIFVLITADAGQTSIAQAIDEEVDFYILKPYTQEVFFNSLKKTVFKKMKPSAYTQLIEEGQAHARGERWDSAREAFQKALDLHPRPALACYQIAEVEKERKNTEEREKWLKKGLFFNKIHYKCLVGLYELYLEQLDVVKAYQIINRISENYPLSPKRLQSILRLAIQTKNFSDIEKHFEIFLNLEERDDELFRYITAALLVCGKFQLKKKNREEGLDLLNRAAVYSGGGTQILRAILTTLMDFELYDEAELILKRFPAESTQTTDYLTCDYLLADKTLGVEEVITRGRKLLGKQIQDPEIYKVLVSRLKEYGKPRDSEELAQEAARRWPEQKEAFLALVT